MKCRKRTHSKKRAFLTAYAATGNVSAAATLAGIARRSHYRWLRADAQYAKRFDSAVEEAADTLEAEARRRAVEGVERPVFHRGQQCGIVREYSDVLLIFLLKGARPEKYRDKANVEYRGTMGEPSRIQVVYSNDWYGNNAHELAEPVSEAERFAKALEVIETGRQRMLAQQAAETGESAPVASEVVRELLNQPEYLDYMRQKAMAEDAGDDQAGEYTADPMTAGDADTAAHDGACRVAERVNVF